LLYICYRNLGRLCYIYVTEILDDSVIYILQNSWRTLFCNIYIITESSKISVTYIYNRVVQDFCNIYITKCYIYVTEILDDSVIYILQNSWTTLLLYICYRNLGRLCYIYVTEILDDSVL
jgi:hypothetical protein